MTKEEICVECTEKYKNLNGVDRKEITHYFLSIPERKANKEWSEIKFNYADDFPTLGKLRKFLAERFPPEEESTAIVDLSEAAHKCKICGLVYANKRRRLDIVHCPRCGDNYSDIIVDASEYKIVYAQDRCFMCPKFESNERGVYGPSCEIFGTGRVCEECRDCACRLCCQAFSDELVTSRDTVEPSAIKKMQTDWRENKKNIIRLAKEGEKFAEDMLRRKKQNAPIGNNIRNLEKSSNQDYPEFRG